MYYECKDYLPGIDATGNLCQNCNVHPKDHKSPSDCKMIQMQPGGSCLCGRAGCQHPKAVVQVQKIFEKARANPRLL